LYHKPKNKGKENIMRKGYGRLANGIDTLAKAPVAELVELFGAWLPVEKAVGPPKRDRLFPR